MIDKTIKNIKKILYKVLYQQKKKILYKVLEGILTAKIANKKKIVFLYFLYIKGLDIKMAAITK